MLVSYRCDGCNRPMLGPMGVICWCGGRIKELRLQYTGPLTLRDDGMMYPGGRRRTLIPIGQEIAEIRARHAKLREYNRVRQTAYNRARRIKNAIPRDDLDQPDR